MKVNVYTKADKITSVKLELNVSEYFIIDKALLNFIADTDMPVDDRLLAVVMTDEMKDKEQIETDELN